MQPTYQHNNITLYHGDCLAVLPTLAAGSVDLVLADLPYGTTACAWDSVLPLDVLWREYRRLLAPRGAVVLTASQPFTSALVTSNPAWFRYCWVWEKQQPTGFLDAQRKPLKAHEDIVVFYPEQAIYNPQDTRPVNVKSGRRNKAGNGVYGDVGGADYVQLVGNFPRSVLHIDRVTQGQQHPTQKPLALMEYLIRTYTNPGACVLDNTMGSGTTGEACVRTGRRFVGMELDPAYYAVAARRIAQAQPPLFVEDAAHDAA